MRELGTFQNDIGVERHGTVIQSDNEKVREGAKEDA
ncbi:hypothetical protein FOXG_22129 [Fusarium oxysporum f. sp. lycopersici 4287]|uniref:Uncharacterized protein n=3 Tax=Fusarium oxysporum TaxID=5507 RepID=A0A0J9W5H0_FUSO4|nr:hypothetical protein FOXG_22129 [Fusarium oxysporum f. sp. lycopersici 4287]EWZ38880.1 hypothetical protein FOZG_08126 [Fusarium oxysporum Fo47]EXK28131.1 hypothetical protein FOMG_15579 [Fusarium oxysporum f. sp. melonis 26406]KNB18113.1 hypothetical protein FOXG_22129 [Fusarium oxysporum f. sp. lycopersici 4287]